MPRGLFGIDHPFAGTPLRPFFFQQRKVVFDDENEKDALCGRNGKDTGLYKESGFCSYPLWTFDETVLKETGGEKYERYARAYDEYMESSFIGMMGAEDETGEEICTGMMM